MPSNELTPAELAALAERLEKGAAGLEGMLSSSSVAPELRAAARCVKAWAKLEGILRRPDDVSFGACVGGEIKILINDMKYHGWATTALAAVEGTEVQG